MHTGRRSPFFSRPLPLQAGGRGVPLSPLRCITTITLILHILSQNPPTESIQYTKLNNDGGKKLQEFKTASPLSLIQQPEQQKQPNTKYEYIIYQQQGIHNSKTTTFLFTSNSRHCDGKKENTPNKEIVLPKSCLWNWKERNWNWLSHKSN